MTINLGDARPGETFMGSLGNNVNYNNMTFAENEERSVWEPFHVRKGFKKEESTVSVFQGWSAINSMGAAGCCRPAQEETLIIMQAFPCLRGAAHPGDGPAGGQPSQGAGVRRSRTSSPSTCRRTSR